MNKQMRISMKALAVILTLSIVLCGVVGGTVAWLIAQTKPVVNTFTYGNIDIDLTETDMTLSSDGTKYENSYEMIPGSTLTKDPLVTVEAGSEACWLFVELTESTDPKFSDYMTYTVNGGWTAVEGYTGVYYMQVAELADDAADFTAAVLKDNAVKVKDTVSKEDIDALEAANAFPSLTVKAYAIQQENIANDAVTAWKLAKGLE